MAALPPMVLSLLILLPQMSSAPATRCVVSKWREWSECYGNCEFAQRVRNRDVIRAALPERDPITGRRRVVGECPALYEVQNCILKECQDEGPFATTRPTAVSHRPGPRPLPPAAVQSEAESGDNKSRAAGTNLYTIVSSRATHENRTQQGGVCSLPDARCCKTERRVHCPDGSKPKQLIKWHRLKDESFCRPFHYPYCGAKLEELEVPLVTEASCTELCFSTEEKTIFASLRLL